jgi:hypothetical protein
MAIRVLPSTAIAVAISYIQPVYAASWVDIQVEASVTFPDRLAVDILNPIDGVVLFTTKKLQDTAAFEDQPSLDVEKVVDSEVQPVSDDTTKTVGKGISDTQATADTTTKDVAKTLVDSTEPADLLAKAFIKALADATDGFTDATTVEALKGLAETLVLVDVVDDIEYFIEKVLADNQVIAEALAVAFTKAPIQDTIAAPQDLVALEPNKGLGDTVDTPQDALQNQFTKVVADSATVTDVVLVVREFVRAFTESSTLADAYSSDFSPATPPESLTQTDLAIFGVGKGFTDSAVMIDNMDGDLTYAFVKLVSELMATTDAQVLDIFKQTTDNVLGDDAGSLIMQDYADITYFAEDYVGVSRTF